MNSEARMGLSLPICKKMRFTSGHMPFQDPKFSELFPIYFLDKTFSPFVYISLICVLFRNYLVSKSLLFNLMQIKALYK